MNRIVVAALAVLALAAGCSSSGDDEEAATTTTTTEATTTTATTAPSTTTTVLPACEGDDVGAVPADAVVTWVADGALRTDDGCLAEVGAARTLEWGGAGDRVVVGHSVLVTGSPPAEAFDADPVVLSRPTGTAVLHVDGDGHLLKREIGGAEPRDISFMAHHEQAVYHPAGRHIVSSGTNEAGGAELLIADNEGSDPLPLLTIEDANDVFDPVFAADGSLLYTAEHDDHIDLHRLRIGESIFGTLATVPKPSTIDHVVPSAFDANDVVWTQGDCAAGQTPELMTLIGAAGALFPNVPREVFEHAEPVGWLPDHSVVFVDRDDCDDDAPGTLRLLRDGDVDVIAEDVTAAAVRAELPPPPAPPPDIPSQAPA